MRRPVDDQRVSERSILDGKDATNTRRGVDGGSETVDRFRREGDDTTISEDFRGSIEGDGVEM